MGEYQALLAEATDPQLEDERLAQVLATEVFDCVRINRCWNRMHLRGVA